MEDMIRHAFIEYPVAATVLTVVAAAHALALAFVNLTPTPRDNEIVKRFYTVVEWVAGIVSKRTKDK